GDLRPGPAHARPGQLHGLGPGPGPAEHARPDGHRARARGARHLLRAHRGRALPAVPPAGAARSRGRLRVLPGAGPAEVAPGRAAVGRRAADAGPGPGPGPAAEAAAPG